MEGVGTSGVVGATDDTGVGHEAECGFFSLFTILSARGLSGGGGVRRTRGGFDSGSQSTRPCTESEGAVVRHDDDREVRGRMLSTSGMSL